MDDSDDDIWDYNSTRRFTLSQVVKTKKSGDTSIIAQSQSLTLHSVHNHPDTRRHKTTKCTKNSRKVTSKGKEKIQPYSSKANGKTSKRSTTGISSTSHKSCVVSKINAKNKLQTSLCSSDNKQSDVHELSQKENIVSPSTCIEISGLDDGVDLKCGLTFQERKEDEKELFCPICQVPFSAFSTADAQGAHVLICMDSCSSLKPECHHGVSCTDRTVDHYKKYQHTKLASLRSENLRNISATSAQHEEIDNAKRKLKFSSEKEIDSKINECAKQTQVGVCPLINVGDVERVKRKVLMDENSSDCDIDKNLVSFNKCLDSDSTGIYLHNNQNIEVSRVENATPSKQNGESSEYLTPYKMIQQRRSMSPPSTKKILAKRKSTTPLSNKKLSPKRSRSGDKKLDQSQRSPKLSRLKLKKSPQETEDTQKTISSFFKAQLLPLKCEKTEVSMSKAIVGELVLSDGREAEDQIPSGHVDKHTTDNKEHLEVKKDLLKTVEYESKHKVDEETDVGVINDPCNSIVKLESMPSSDTLEVYDCRNHPISDSSEFIDIGDLAKVKIPSPGLKTEHTQHCDHIDCDCPFDKFSNICDFENPDDDNQPQGKADREMSNTNGGTVGEYHTLPKPDADALFSDSDDDLFSNINNFDFQDPDNCDTNHEPQFTSVKINDNNHDNSTTLTNSQVTNLKPSSSCPSAFVNCDNKTQGDNKIRAQQKPIPPKGKSMNAFTMLLKGAQNVAKGSMKYLGYGNKTQATDTTKNNVPGTSYNRSFKRSSSDVNTVEKTESSGSRNFQRRCPFYKKLPGTPFTVDAFRYGSIPDCSVYFLTHFHYDHYGGLTKSFHHPLYCSKITANLVLKKIRVDKQIIHPMDLNRPYMVEGVEVTLLEANHCPGAVLFLFKLKDGRVYLHTGDFRADPSMESYPELSNVTVDTLYLDTTYCDPQYSFPPQCDVVRFAVQLTVDFLHQNPNTLVVVGSYTIGKERIFLAIAEELRSKICVLREKKTILDCLENDKINRMITLNKHEARVHVLPMGKLKYDNLQDHLKQVKPRYDQILAFEPTGWTHSKRSLGLDNIRPKFKRDNITLYGVPYSEHSSYTELKRFTQFTKPQKIIPTVNNGNPASRKKMEELFAAWITEAENGAKQKQTAINNWFKT